MKVCSFFNIFLIFRLYIISPFFTPLFHKTTVNVQPLSPPVFNKIATHSKNLRLFTFLYLGLHVFNLLLFLLIFRSPLAPSWCRMGWKWCQILILWVVFWYNSYPWPQNQISIYTENVHQTISYFYFYEKNTSNDFVFYFHGNVHRMISYLYFH